MTILCNLIKILHNANGLYNRSQEVLIFLKYHNIDIILVLRSDDII